jgi:hypothetical protein
MYRSLVARRIRFDRAHAPRCGAMNMRLRWIKRSRLQSTTLPRAQPSNLI